MSTVDVLRRYAEEALRQAVQYKNEKGVGRTIPRLYRRDAVRLRAAADVRRSRIAHETRRPNITNSCPAGAFGWPT
jgi:hypothetical protein